MTDDFPMDALERGRVGFRWWINASGVSLGELHRMTAVGKNTMYSFNLDADEVQRVATYIDKLRPLPLEAAWRTRLNEGKTTAFLYREVLRVAEEKPGQVSDEQVAVASTTLASLDAQEQALTEALRPLTEQWAGMSLVPGGEQQDMRQRRCLRCDNRWTSRTRRPKRCPSCYSNIWDDPAKALVAIGE